MGYVFALVALGAGVLALVAALSSAPEGALALGAVALVVGFVTYRRDMREDEKAPRFMAAAAMAMGALAVLSGVLDA